MYFTPNYKSFTSDHSRSKMPSDEEYEAARKSGFRRRQQQRVDDVESLRGGRAEKSFRRLQDERSMNSDERHSAIEKVFKEIDDNYSNFSVIEQDCNLIMSNARREFEAKRDKLHQRATRLNHLPKARAESPSAENSPLQAKKAKTSNGKYIQFTLFLSCSPVGDKA